MEIKTMNDALKHQGRYQGVYERSDILVNGKPSWNNNVHAIWYVSKRDEWVVGNLTDLGHNDKDRDTHNMYANALGYRFHLDRLTDNVWKYWNGSKWNSPIHIHGTAIYYDNVIVSCKGT